MNIVARFANLKVHQKCASGKAKFFYQFKYGFLQFRSNCQTEKNYQTMKQIFYQTDEKND